MATKMGGEEEEKKRAKHMRRLLLRQRLELHVLVVPALERKQLVMRALLAHPAILDEVNAVRVLDR